MKLNKQDKELIEYAYQTAKSNLDFKGNEGVIVGCAVRAKSGVIYKGINLKSSHSVCAEQVALAQAFACGERELESIVAVKIENGEERVVSPCGLCRYMFDKFNLNLNVIVEDVQKNKVLKVKAKELLPYPYEREVKKRKTKLKG